MASSDNYWARAIRAFRVQHGMKQIVLATLLGVDQSTISRWERGVDTPSIAMRRRLREYLRQPFPELEARMAEFIRKTPGVLCLATDTDFKLLEINTAHARQVRWERAEWLGRAALGAMGERHAEHAGRIARINPYSGEVAGLAGVCECDSPAGVVHVYHHDSVVPLSDGSLATISSGKLIPRRQFNAFRQTHGTDVLVIGLDDLID